MTPPSLSRRWGLVVAAAVSYTCLMFIWFSLPAFLGPVTDDIDLSSTQAGIVVGAVPLTYIPLALFTGLLVDRIGPGRMIGTGVICYGLGQIGRSEATGFPTLFVFTLAIGVGATTITFGLPKLVAILFPADRTGAPSALYLIGASVGSATVFATGRPFLEPIFGDWRGVFFWSGVIAVGYGIMWFVVSYAAHLDRGVFDDTDPSLGAMWTDLRLVLTHRDLQWIVVIGTMYLFLTHGLQGWLPTLLEARGLAADAAGQTTSLLVVALAVGTLTVPSLADRVEARRGALVSCGIVIVLGVSLLAVLDLGLPVLAAIVIAGIGVGGISPLLRAIPPALDGVGARLTGTAVAFIFAVGEIGGFLGPFVIGALHDVTGTFLPGVVMLGIAGVVIILAAWRLRSL